MGQTWGRHLPQISRRHSLNLLIVGLERSGKTSVVSSLQLNPWQPQPTTHFSKPTLVLYKDTLLRLYDLGGRLDLRKTWTEYLPEVHALVFVVDATDQSCHRDAAMALRRLLQHKSGKDKHMLVLANKQDLPGALSSEEIAWSLSLEQYSEELVQAYPCKAKLHSGARALDWRMQAGIDWLVDAVTAEYRPIDRRVRRDKAHGAKAALEAESLRVDNSDPFLWKSRHNRKAAGRSIAQATLAAFEQATSRRWGGTVVPARPTIPSDIDEGENEDDDVQETDTAGITPTEMYGSENSFSVGSDGEETPSQAQGHGNFDWVNGTCDDSVEMLKARWRALGLLWPDEQTCRSLINQINNKQPSRSHAVPEPSRAPSKRMGLWGGKAAASTRKPAAAGGSRSIFHSSTCLGDSETLKLPVASGAGDSGPPCVSPRGGMKLPPVQAWGSFKQEKAGKDQSVRFLKSAMRARSQPGIVAAGKADGAAPRNGTSTSSPGEGGVGKVLQFK